MGVLIDLTGGGNTPPITIAAANIPAAMRAAPWHFTWIPTNASGSQPQAFATIAVFDEGALNSGFFYDRDNTLLVATDITGATVMSVSCTFDAADAIRLELNPVAMTLRVSGANTGNGTHAISGTLANLWPSGNDLRIGSDYGGDFEAIGTWLDIEDDGDASTPRERLREDVAPDALPRRRLAPLAALGVPAYVFSERRLALREDEIVYERPRRRVLSFPSLVVAPSALDALERPRTIRDEALFLEPPQRRELSFAAHDGSPPPAAPSGARRPRDRQRGRDRWRGH